MRDDDNEILIACDTFAVGETVIHQGWTYRPGEIKGILKERPEAFLSWADSTTGERRARNTELMEKAGVFG